MADVIPQQFFLDPAQSGADCADLRDDIDAIAICIEHFGQPTHLAFDAVEPFPASGLDVSSHYFYIPPLGISIYPL